MKELNYRRLCGEHTISGRRGYFPDATCSILSEQNQVKRTKEFRGDTVPYDFNSDSIEHTIFRYEPNLN